MSKQELKSKIVEHINQLDDELLLAEIYDLVHIELTSNDEVYTLSKEQKQAIEQGCEQIDSGDFLTDEEANKQIECWFEQSGGQ